MRCRYGIRATVTALGRIDDLRMCAVVFVKLRGGNADGEPATRGLASRESPKGSAYLLSIGGSDRDSRSLLKFQLQGNVLPSSSSRILGHARDNRGKVKRPRIDDLLATPNASTCG